MPVFRRAEKVLKGLDWQMQLRFDHLSEEVLASDKYLVEMLRILDILAGERETSEMRRSVRAALYEGSRKADESLAQYSLRRDSQFTQASRFLPLPSELKAVMLEEQANLSKQGLQNLRVLTGGKSDYETVRKAMQLMDVGEESLFKSSGKPSYVVSETSGEGAVAADFVMDKESDSEDDETFFFAVEEMNLGEDEALVFLADWKTEGFKNKRRSWSDNKKLKMAQKKDRRHFEDGGRADKPPHRRRLSIQELKKVTKCANCGERGHWREDCRKPFKPKATGVGDRPGSNGAAPSAFVFLGSGSSSSRPSFFGMASVMALSENSCFLTLPGGHAIIDPGASQDIIGLKSYERLKNQLQEVGLQTVELADEPSSATGIGGKASSVMSALCPCVLGGVPGIIKLTVVAEDVPQLISVGLLDLAGAVIHVSSGKVVFENFGKETIGKKIETGHLTLDLTDWPGGIFPVPQQVTQEHGVQPGAFNLARVSDEESYVRPIMSEGGPVHQYLLEVSSPKGFRGWTTDPIGNLVLISSPNVGFRKPSIDMKAGKYRSTWLCSSSAVANLETCVEWGSSEIQIQDASFCRFANSFSTNSFSTSRDESSEASRVLTSHQNTHDNPFDVHVSVFHAGSHEEFSQSLHELYGFESPLPRDSCKVQGELLCALEGSSRLRCETRAVHGAAPSSEATYERECSQCGKGALVLVGEEAAEETREVIHSTSSSGVSRVWRRREDEDSTECGGREGCSESSRGSVPSSGEHGHLRSQSTWNMEAMPGLPDQDSVCALRTGKPFSSIPEEEHDSHDLCGKGTSDTQPNQEHGGEQLIRGHRVADGADHGDSESNPAEWNDGSRGSGCGSSGSGSIRVESEPAEHGTAAVSGSAGIAESGHGGDPNWLGRRGDDGACGSQERLLETLGPQVRGLASFLEAIGVSQCTENLELDQWFIKPCCKLSSCGCDLTLGDVAFLVQLKSQHRSFDFFVWWDPQLVGDLCIGDINDDREFHLPRKVKRNVRRNIESFLARSFRSTGRSDDGRNEKHLTPALNQKEEFQQTATGEDGRTSEPTGPKQEGESQQTATDEDGRTSEPIGPCSRIGETTRLNGAKEFIGDHWYEEVPRGLPDAVRTGLVSDAVRAVASAPVASFMAMASPSRRRFKVMELFSPPRLVPFTDRAGFGKTEPSSFDRVGGWEFFQAADRAALWKVIREQEPDLIAMSPECRPFSQMMNCNWDRMSPSEVNRVREEGLAMWHFCILVALHQVKCGKFFLLEQPAGASSWRTHLFRLLFEDPSIFFFWFDQCMGGLSVVEGTVSQKTTGIATNHGGIAYELSQLQCDRSHEHLQLQNGLTHKARVYPEGMLKKIVRGLGHNLPAESFAAIDSEFDEPEEGEDLEDMLDREVDGAVEPRREINPGLSEEQKKKINLIHVNMGHISNAQMMSLLKAAGAKPEVLQYVKHRFSCEQCQKQQKPINRKRVTMPRTFAFNRVIGIDFFFIPFQNETMAFINVVCHGTNLQQVARLHSYGGGSPSSKETWRLFQQLWIRPYGLPELVVSDGGSEFKNYFERSLEQAGVMQIVCDASSPWQNGKVERHGGWLKSRAEAELESGQSIIMTVEDLEDLIHDMLIHKNRWFSHGGFSPAQLAFGMNPRIPADLLADDPLQGPGWDDIYADPYDQDTVSAEYSRSHLIRQRARELCIAQTSRDKVRLGGKGKRHHQRQWAIGQWVFVWRRTPGIPVGHVSRSRWTGPGVVVMQHSHTVWVSMRSRLLKCSSDQLRPATHFESLGADLSQTGEIQELLQQVRSSRAGAVDVQSEGTPPQEAFDEQVPLRPGIHQPVVQDALPTIHEEEEDGGLDSSQPGRGHVLRDAPEAESPQIHSGRRIEEPVRRVSVAEPEPSPSEASTNSEESKRRKIEIASVEEPPETRDRAPKRSSELQNQKLEKLAIKELRRLNREERSRSMASSSSVPPVGVQVASQVDVTSSTSGTALATPEPVDDIFNEEESSVHQHANYFVGFAELQVKEDGNFLIKNAKTKNAEFDMRQANPEDLLGFQGSDATEWSNILKFGAARILSPEEAQRVRNTLPHRIITSRMIRRKKPVPGVHNFKYKSRWCVHGHVDPDSGSFKTFAPMPCSEAILRFFQLSLNLNLSVSFADVQQAFCQSEPLNRPQGDLYVQACDGLGIPRDSLIKLIAPVYGLDDAPIRWHCTLLKFFQGLGFERSLLECCWLVKRERSRIVAMILIEVDDINVAATSDYFEELQKMMQDRFSFGKWEHNSADFAGRTVTFLEDRVLMHQEKYILEKLNTLKLPKGMRSDHSTLLPEDLFESYRSMLYRVNWLAHQTRPEASGIISILSSRLKNASVHDLCCLNKLIAHIKGTASQPLVLHKFRNEDMVFIASSDAGGVAAKSPVEELPGQELTDPIQGAWVVLAAEKIPAANRPVKVSVLSWRSSKLKRRVASTLASEALAFDQALGELEWLQIMFRDVVHHDVNRSDWRRSITPFQAVLREDCELYDRLQQCTITDAKSLFDAIQHENPSSRQDRRTATELAIILEAVRKTSSVIRWSPHPRMIADVLTKDDISKSNGAFEELLKCTKLTLWDESAELLRRKQEPKTKNRSKKASGEFRFREECEQFLVDTQGNKNLGVLFIDSIFDCQVLP